MNQQLNNHFSQEEMYRLKQIVSLIDRPIQDAAVTLEFFRSEYEKHIKNNRSQKYLCSVKLAFNHLEYFFQGQRIITTISLRDAEEFIDEIKRSAPKGYRVYYRTIKAAFNKAMDWGYIKSNPFVKIKLGKKQMNKPEYINKDQLEAIIKKIKSQIVKDAATFAFYTGCRLGELINLKWENINLDKKVITIGDEEFKTKGRKQRFIPMNNIVLELLTQTYKNGVGYVFCKSNGKQFTGDYFSRKFKAACREAGISEKIHWHSLRHSFASHLVMKDVPLYTIKELLGHTSITTTEIYSHLNIDALKNAIEKLDDN